MDRWITPAWAGKRPSSAQAPFVLEDHPRVGGEKLERPQLSWLPRGSPPRGRGKVPGSASGHPAPRITPAWAGKSSGSDGVRKSAGDHPRVGGEKQTSTPETGRPLGSPPRGRGKERMSSTAYQRAGITPAWAGKRKRVSPSRNRAKDHPRVGGEKTHASKWFCLP